MIWLLRLLFPGIAEDLRSTEQRADLAEGLIEPLRRENEDFRGRLRLFETSSAQLEASNAALQRENEFLRAQMERAIDAERFAMRTMANLTFQNTHGIAPYPEAAHLKPEQVDVAKAGKPLVAKSVQGIDLVRQRQQEFLDRYREMYKDGEGPLHPSVLGMVR